MTREEFFEEVRNGLKTARAEMPPTRVTAIGIHFKTPLEEVIRQPVLAHSALTRRGVLTEASEKYFGRFYKNGTPFTMKVGKRVYYQYKGGI